MITGLIKNRSIKEKIELKGIEIAKINIPKTQRKDYKIEITNIKTTEKGIEVFARAWDKNGQIGFGKDGTIDIERFKIAITADGDNGHLTHLVVPDENGDIEVEYNKYDPVFKKIVSRIEKYREDPTENLLIKLENIIRAKKQKSDSSKIISGKVGTTTSSLNPVAGSNAPVDGRVRRNGVNETFATIRNANGTAAFDSDAFTSIGLFASGSTNQYEELVKVLMGFPTGDIGAGQNVDSATLLLFSDLSGTGVGDTDFDILDDAPASPSSLAASDYENSLSTTRLATGIAISAWNVGSYTTFTFITAGEDHIDVTDDTFMSMRLKWDVDNNFTGSWSSGALTRVRLFFVDDADSNKHPNLIVEHSVAAAAFTPKVMFVG